MNVPAAAAPDPVAAAAGPVLRSLLPIYADAMQIRHYAARTIETQQRLSRWFIDWCEERELTVLFAVDVSASGLFGSQRRSKLQRRCWF